MKKVILILFILSISLFSAFTQSSDELSKLIDTQTVTYSEVSYLPALYNNLISENDNPSQAFQALKANNYIAAESDGESEVTLAQVSGLLVKSLEIKGGLFYSLFKSDRYAYKELKARGLLPQTADPSSKVTGRDFIDLFNACLEITGDNK